MVAGAAGTYLLLEASHGDAVADPRRRPALGLIRDGQGEILFEAEAAALRTTVSAPRDSDARSTRLISLAPARPLDPGPRVFSAATHQEV
jgi:hypothetical protein